jgi:hypothetical protein
MWTEGGRGIHHGGMTVTFGGLKGELAYEDEAFDLDPDIQEMFYGLSTTSPDAGR